MGTCIAMGQAVGTAAAMLLEAGATADVRNVDLAGLQAALRRDGAILDGTH
jgi:rhodanese-related sulfurtransferase